MKKIVPFKGRLELGPKMEPEAAAADEGVDSVLKTMNLVSWWLVESLVCGVV